LGGPTQYTGDDRREWGEHPVGRAARRSRGAPAIAGILLVATALGWLGLPAIDVLNPVLAVLVIVLGAMAAAACALHWRVARDAPAALLGSTLLLHVLGLAVLVIAAASHGLDVARADEVRTVHLLLSIGACAFALAAVRHDHIDTGMRVGRLLAVALVLLAVPGIPLLLSGGLPTEIRAVLRVVAFGVLLLAALQLSRRFDRAGAGPHGWAAPVVVLLALGQLLRVVGYGFAGGRIAANTVLVGAMAIAVAGACDDLVRSLSGTRQRLYETLVDRRVAAVTADGERTLGRTRAHDLRSAVTAIQGASLVLERYADTLAEDDQVRLRRSVTEQAGRLSELVQQDVPVDTFAVLPVVRSARAAAGVRSDLHADDALETAEVHGRPVTLAAVLGGVLGSAARDRPTDITVERSGDHVVVRVDPPRGTWDGLAGDALSMEAAARLVAEDGGSLVVDLDGGITLAFAAVDPGRTPG
jgi:signal transduction histidine kinase